ncbi:MAG TPA: glycosyltransferase family 4 protein [Gaiellaceae bacterium]
MRSPGRAVCLVRQGYFPGEARVRREAQALHDAGFRVDVVCLRGPGEPAREHVDGVDVHRLRLQHRRAGLGRSLYEYAVFFVLATARVSRLYARRRYSVVQVNTMPDVLVFCALVPRLFGARIILDMQEVMPELFSSKFGGRHAWLIRLLVRQEAAAAGFADAVIAVSDPTRTVVERRGIPAAKLTVVMNSADERLFSPRPRRVARAADDLVLVTHGTLIEGYGFETAIRAMPSVVAAIPRARLQVVGGGEYASELVALAERLGVAASVEFLGHRVLDDIPAILAEADVGIVPNELPGFTDVVVPTKLMELVAMGVPAVAARSSAVEHYFDPSMVASYSVGDAEDLAATVIELARDPEKRVSYAQNAMRVLERHGWRRMSYDYTQLISKLASVG